MASLLRGNTIYYTVKFFDLDGETPIDPDNERVKFIVYDNDYVMASNIILASGCKRGIGVYRYGYIPDKSGGFTIEFYAEFEGLPSLCRKNIFIVEI